MKLDVSFLPHMVLWVCGHGSLMFFVLFPFPTSLREPGRLGGKSYLSYLGPNGPVPGVRTEGQEASGARSSTLRGDQCRGRGGRFIMCGGQASLQQRV